MEESLLKYFKIKRKSISIEQIKNDLQIRTEDVPLLMENLRKMELDAKLYVDQDNNYMLFPKSGKYVQGKLKRDASGNFYVSGLNIYVSTTCLNGALEGDTVIVVRDNCSASSSRTGKISRIVLRNDKNYVFECKVIDNEKKLLPLDYQPIDEIVFDKSCLDNLVDGTRVLVEISKEKVNGKYIGNVLKEVGHKDDPDIRIKEIAVLSGVDIEFSKEAIEEANRLPNSVNENDIKGRVDLRDKQIFTIDGENTKDIDDAISLEINEKGNYILGVHIADVAYYVKPDSKLFDEAVSRANSVYALDCVIPMLPHKLSNGICSLNPNEDRLTKSCIMEIDRNGNLIDYRICDTVIKSSKKCLMKKLIRYLN